MMATSFAARIVSPGKGSYLSCFRWWHDMNIARECFFTCLCCCCRHWFFPIQLLLPVSVFIVLF